VRKKFDIERDYLLSIFVDSFWLSRIQENDEKLKGIRRDTFPLRAKTIGPVFLLTVPDGTDGSTIPRYYNLKTQ